MFRRRRKLLPVLAPLWLACAGQRAESVPSVEKLTKEAMRYQAVQVEPFTIAPAGVKEKDPEAYLRKAEETCVRVLLGSELFESVGTGGAADASDPTLVVRAELLSLKIVSGGQKQWLGLLAGKSEMKVRVTLADAQSGAVLATKVIEQDAETAGGPWSFGATDRSLPAEVGTRIAETAALGAGK